MKNTLETRLGMFAAVIVLAAVALVEILGGAERFQRTYVLHALFGGTQELKKGDPVKMAGVEIGRVKSIDLSETNNKVIVTLKLKEKYKVRTDAVAMVKYTGLMGQNFIAHRFWHARISLPFGKQLHPDRGTAGYQRRDPKDQQRRRRG